MSDTNEISELNIREADRLEVTILVDKLHRYAVSGKYRHLQKTPIPFPQILLAEHGLSCLIKVYAGAEEHIVIMDAAVTPACLFGNSNLLKAELGRIEAVS